MLNILLGFGVGFLVCLILGVFFLPQFIQNELYFYQSRLLQMTLKEQRSCSYPVKEPDC